MVDSSNTIIIKNRANKCVLRGGSWNYYVKGCRVAFRFNDLPVIRYNFDGFRLLSGFL
jgi:formylglycine-generating enzyme required for sulfatase activity